MLLRKFQLPRPDLSGAETSPESNPDVSEAFLPPQLTFLHDEIAECKSFSLPAEYSTPKKNSLLVFGPDSLENPHGFLRSDFRLASAMTMTLPSKNTLQYRLFEKTPWEDTVFLREKIAQVREQFPLAIDEKENVVEIFLIPREFDHVELVGRLMAQKNLDFVTARSYLESVNWSLQTALSNVRIDEQQGSRSQIDNPQSVQTSVPPMIPFLVKIVLSNCVNRGLFEKCVKFLFDYGFWGKVPPLSLYFGCHGCSFDGDYDMTIGCREEIVEPEQPIVDGESDESLDDEGEEEEEGEGEVRGDEQDHRVLAIAETNLSTKELFDFSESLTWEQFCEVGLKTKLPVLPKSFVTLNVFCCDAFPTFVPFFGSLLRCLNLGTNIGGRIPFLSPSEYFIANRKSALESLRTSMGAMAVLEHAENQTRPRGSEKTARRKKRLLKGIRDEVKVFLESNQAVLVLGLSGGDCRFVKSGGNIVVMDLGQGGLRNLFYAVIGSWSNLFRGRQLEIVEGTQTENPFTVKGKTIRLVLSSSDRDHWGGLTTIRNVGIDAVSSLPKDSLQSKRRRSSITRKKCLFREKILVETTNRGFEIECVPTSFFGDCDDLEIAPSHQSFKVGTSVVSFDYKLYVTKQKKKWNDEVVALPLRDKLKIADPETILGDLKILNDCPDAVDENDKSLLLKIFAPGSDDVVGVLGSDRSARNLVGNHPPGPGRLLKVVHIPHHGSGTMSRFIDRESFDDRFFNTFPSENYILTNYSKAGNLDIMLAAFVKFSLKTVDDGHDHPHLYSCRSWSELNMIIRDQKTANAWAASDSTENHQVLFCKRKADRSSLYSNLKDHFRGRHRPWFHHVTTVKTIVVMP